MKSHPNNLAIVHFFEFFLLIRFRRLYFSCLSKVKFCISLFLEEKKPGRRMKRVGYDCGFLSARTKWSGLGIGGKTDICCYNA